MQKKLAVFYRVFVRIQNVYFGNAGERYLHVKFAEAYAPYTNDDAVVSHMRNYASAKTECIYKSEISLFPMINNISQFLLFSVHFVNVFAITVVSISVFSCSSQKINFQNCRIVLQFPWIYIFGMRLNGNMHTRIHAFMHHAFIYIFVCIICILCKYLPDKCMAWHGMAWNDPIPSSILIKFILSNTISVYSLQQSIFHAYYAIELYASHTNTICTLFIFTEIDFLIAFICNNFDAMQFEMSTAESPYSLCGNETFIFCTNWNF